RKSVEDQLREPDHGPAPAGEPSGHRAGIDLASQFVEIDAPVARAGERRPSRGLHDYLPLFGTAFFATAGNKRPESSPGRASAPASKRRLRGVSSLTCSGWCSTYPIRMQPADEPCPRRAVRRTAASGSCDRG